MRNTLAPLVLGIVATADAGRLLPRCPGPDHGVRRALGPGPPDPSHGADTRRRAGEDRRDVSVAAPLRRRSDGSRAGARPVAWFLMPWLVRVVLGADYIPATDAARILLLAACAEAHLGWTKFFPVSIGKPGLRIIAHAVEIAVLLPLIVVLRLEVGCDGRAAAVLVATIAFARLGGAPRPAPPRASRRAPHRRGDASLREGARRRRDLAAGRRRPREPRSGRRALPRRRAGTRSRSSRPPPAAPAPGRTRSLHVAAAPGGRTARSLSHLDRVARPRGRRRLHDRDVRAQRVARARPPPGRDQAHRRPGVRTTAGAGP